MPTDQTSSEAFQSLQATSRVPAFGVTRRQLQASAGRMKRATQALASDHAGSVDFVEEFRRDVAREHMRQTLAAFVIGVVFASSIGLLAVTVFPVLAPVQAALWISFSAPLLVAVFAVALELSHWAIRFVRRLKSQNDPEQ